MKYKTVEWFVYDQSMRFIGSFEDRDCALQYAKKHNGYIDKHTTEHDENRIYDSLLRKDERAKCKAKYEAKIARLTAENDSLKSENAELHAKLKKAVVLPCKVGDKVYGIGYTDCSLQHAKTEQEKQKISKFCYKMNGRCDKCKYSLPAIEEFVCTQIQIGDCGIDGVDVLVVGDKCENYLAKNIRKTPEEAEARLAELKGGDKQ